MAELTGFLSGRGAGERASVATSKRRRRGAIGRVASAGERAVKRGLDVVLASVLLLLAAPVLLLLVLCVKATSSGPALFRQQRVGRRGDRFWVLKVRTMVSDAEHRLGRDPNLLETYRSRNFKVPVELDPRVTRVGRAIRRTSLDELPQLVNVLRGEMSLVGPRPVVPEELEQYGEVAALYRSVRPGITGWWQVRGRSQKTGVDRVDLDRYYLERWTLWLDIKILLLTIPAVLRCRGAH